MKKLICFLSFLIFYTALNAATLHAILISATDDPLIGKGAQRNHQFLKKQMLQVEQSTQLQLRLYEYTEKLTSKMVRQFINALQTQSDDVILFYYSGHGINSGQNQWPAFLIPGRSQLGLYEVYRQLKAKPHRLLLSIGDCCNIGTMLKTDSTHLVSKAKAISNSNHLATLFEKASGNIIASGSSPGQTSGYFDNIGGIYTSAFLDALRAALRSPDSEVISWAGIFENTAIVALDMAAVFGDVQKPLYQEEALSPTLNIINTQPLPVLYASKFVYCTVQAGEGFHNIASRLMEAANIEKHDGWEMRTADFAEAIARWNGLKCYSSILIPGQQLRIENAYLQKLVAIAKE